MAHDTGIPKAIPFRTLGPVSVATKVVIGILILIGVAAVVVAAGTGSGRVWESLLFNWLFWSSVSLGMVLFAAALQMSNADWAWSVRRFALGGGTFLPISFVLFLIVLFGGYEHLFSNWLGKTSDPILFKKIAWLNWPGVAVRDIFVILVLYGLSMAYMYYRVRPDVYGVKSTEHRSFYDRITSGFRGVEEEAKDCHKISMRMAPVLAILYGLLWGIISVDLAMSIQPHFYSTMFPPAFIWTGFDGGVVLTAIMVAVFYRRMRLESFVTERQFHDLGMLVFAFSVFWMYLNWGQYIVIWYGQLPFEQIFFIKRFEAPYGPIASAVVIFIFVLPFLGLLSKTP
ncbi:MAG TPA: hypothetical protein VFI96_02020, partial [Longimicrobiaceae bacterium]|nr:hypothetical protein [Longimicrobiaceae bacterium]